ncbi:sigma-70 family RNA polymerase sigma factor [Aliiglaciecola sp. LCG003]|uniref:RNA polymerase sigma factor n=1 Tax=Aliiglaciecola sp. LCG003 TaxID=3053655 RepID=UPI00257432AD|nr:sigma-70 family RNA polymerase sigma factor [Aliiglaciecola sp. LCG003]WJG11234.1 sigma-70 family RNA polymerase sigma factor [Aliiglaciecola sp. LCG003]
MLNTQGNVIAAQDTFTDKSERDLISAVQQGDRKAYQALYQYYIGQVYGLCLRLTSDKTLAEDAAQEVFIQLWRKIGNYKGESKFSTWLHTVTSNITISYLRKQRGWLQRMFNIEESEAMHHSAEEQMDLSDLEGYVARLPERARIVFVLHAIEGYRHEDIAQMMNMAVGSSKAQFHRAKQLLKEWMGYAE